MKSKVNVLFSSFPDFSGNPKALYEYMFKNYGNDFNLFWVFYSKAIVDTLNTYNKKINFVLYKSKEYNALIKKIDIIFDTNGFLITEKSENQVYVNLWHGASPKKKGYLLSKENFAPQDNAYYKSMHLYADYVVVPSEFSRLVFSSVFDINAQRVIPLGYCRDDYLSTSNGKQLLKDLFNIDVANYNKVLCYLPTFRVGCNRNDSYDFWENNLLDLDKYDEKELYNFLKDNNYLLLIKKHPSEESKIKISNSENVIVLDEDQLTKNLISVYEILNAVDLLIADYSSVYVEYLLLTRPVAFLHRNLSDYTQNRGIILNNINFWSPGPQINTIDSFKKDVSKLLENPNYYLKERLNFKKIMFDDNSENICKKTFDFFFNNDSFSLNCKPFYTDEKKLIEDFRSLKTEKESLENEIQTLKFQNSQLNENTLAFKTELEIIYNSRSWKAVNTFQKIKKLIKRRK